MRIIGLVVIFLGVGIGVIGLFFGRASWIGLNNHSIPTWVLLEVLAVMLLILGFGIKFYRASH